MRYLFFFTVLLAIACRVPKTLKGQYFESFGSGWGGATYTFHPDGTFEYAAHYDIGGMQGIGRYKINGRRLNLIFSGDSLNGPPSEIHCTQFIPQDSTWQINIVVMDDTTHEPLYGALVIISDSLEKNLTGKSTDIEGKAAFRITGHTGPLKVTVRYVGMQITTTQLHTPGYYSLDAHMAPCSLSQPIPYGTLWKYRIIYYSADDSFFNITPLKSVADGIGAGPKRLDKIPLNP